jgi:hypothetical protein
VGTTVDASLWGVVATVLIPEGFIDYSAMPKAAQRSASGHADNVIAAYGNREYVAQFSEHQLIKGAKLVLIRGRTTVGTPNVSRQEFAQSAAQREQRGQESNSSRGPEDLNELLSPELSAKRKFDGSGYIHLRTLRLDDRAVGEIELMKVSTPVLNHPDHLMLEADVDVHIKDRVLNVLVIEPCFGPQSLDDIQSFTTKYLKDLISANP